MLEEAPASTTSRPCLCWITAPKRYSPSPEYELSCFMSRMKQVLEGASKLCAERQQHVQNQKACDFNNFWITHVGVRGVGSQSVSYMPH